jgi:transcriptional regulator with XRE-family HTH domain
MILIFCRLISIMCLFFSMNSTLQYNLAKNLRLHREQKALSQDDLAHLCGLHRTYIGGIERSERNITLKTLEKIAEALALDPLILLREDGLGEA